MLLWPIVWALCFSLFAVLGASALTPTGPFGAQLVKPWVAGRRAVRRVQGAAAARPPGDARRPDAVPGRRAARGLIYGRAAIRSAGAATAAARSGASGRAGAGVAARGRRRDAPPDLQAPRGAPATRRADARPVDAAHRRGVAATLFGGYVSPFSAQVTIFVAIVAAGLPVAVSYGAMGLEFSVGRFTARGMAALAHTAIATSPAPDRTPAATSSSRRPTATAPRRPRSTSELLWDA